MKKGDLIFVKNKGFLFSKIRKILDCDYDHVGIMLTENTFIDSTPFKGVAIRKLEVLNNLDKCIYELKGGYKSYINTMLDYCLDKVGSGYDIIQVISLYFLIILGIKKTLNPIDVKNAFVCSELIAEAADSAGFKFDENIEIDRITPADIIKSDRVIKVGDGNA